MIRGVESLRGQLLIASPSLLEPNFHRAVVLIGEHNEEGALGVVLNRPAPASVQEAAPPLAPLVGGEESLFIGGPVQSEAAVVVAEFEYPDAAGLVVFDSIGFLMGEVDPLSVQGVRRARVFAGYAGWGAGQLEAELELSAWMLEPATPGDVFSDQPAGLWSAVLRRKGGRYAMLALMPVDPSLN
jgi:putative transcriptional regulator